MIYIYKLNKLNLAFPKQENCYNFLYIYRGNILQQMKMCFFSLPSKLMLTLKKKK